VDLRRETGLPPQATMRSHLRTLTDTGVVARQRQNEFPGALEYEITTVGRELWAVAQVLGGWPVPRLAAHGDRAGHRRAKDRWRPNRHLAEALLEGLHGSLFAPEHTAGTGTQL